MVKTSSKKRKKVAVRVQELQISYLRNFRQIVASKKLPYLAEVYRQINDMIQIKSHGSELTRHSLEKGLSNEEIMRRILREILPQRYGIGKGIIANSQGRMSKQTDIIIYDALNCPNLFVDENMNQVLPIEGIYAVAEVKTQSSSSKIREGFDQIDSVKRLCETKIDVSTNDHVRIIPPLGYIIAFKDKRSLETIYDNYIRHNGKYRRTFSSLSYSRKSPGYKDHTKRHFLVESVVIADRGEIHYSYGGVPMIFPAGGDTLGCFIVSLLLHLQEMNLPIPSLLHYYGFTTILYEQKTKTEKGFVAVN